MTITHEQWLRKNILIYLAILSGALRTCSNSFGLGTGRMGSNGTEALWGPNDVRQLGINQSQRDLVE
jgi:hypothetical protein